MSNKRKVTNDDTTDSSVHSKKHKTEGIQLAKDAVEIEDKEAKEEGTTINPSFPVIAVYCNVTLVTMSAPCAVPEHPLFTTDHQFESFPTPSRYRVEGEPTLRVTVDGVDWKLLDSDCISNEGDEFYQVFYMFGPSDDSDNNLVIYVDYVDEMLLTGFLTKMTVEVKPCL